MTYISVLTNIAEQLSLHSYSYHKFSNKYIKEHDHRPKVQKFVHQHIPIGTFPIDTISNEAFPIETIYI